MRFNTDLAERVLAQIKDHPETWDQGEWRCETGMCFAGWVAELSQQKWAADGSPYLENGEHCGDFADAELGLGLDRSTALFWHRNDLDTIERLVKHFANNPDDNSLPGDLS